MSYEPAPAGDNAEETQAQARKENASGMICCAVTGNNIPLLSQSSLRWIFKQFSSTEHSLTLLQIL